MWGIPRLSRQISRLFKAEGKEHGETNCRNEPGIGPSEDRGARTFYAGAIGIRPAPRPDSVKVERTARGLQAACNGCARHTPGQLKSAEGSNRRIQTGVAGHSAGRRPRPERVEVKGRVRWYG